MLVTAFLVSSQVVMLLLQTPDLENRFAKLTEALGSHYSNPFHAPSLIKGHLHKTCTTLQVAQSKLQVVCPSCGPRIWSQLWAFSRGTYGKESTSQCRRCKRQWSDPWMGKIPWRRKWHPSPVCLPGESHGQRSLLGYRPWGPSRVHDRSDTHGWSRAC